MEEDTSNTGAVARVGQAALPQPTCVATVALQSGESRVVIAVLRVSTL